MALKQEIKQAIEQPLEGNLVSSAISNNDNLTQGSDFENGSQNLLKTSQGDDFQQKFRAKCIQGSAIALSQYDAAVQVTTEERGGEIHALLGWRYARFGHQVPHSFGSFAGFYQEDGELWQGKAEKLPQGITGKYLAPKGIGARAFLPAVPREQRRAIAKRYGCEVPPSGKSFWAWLAEHPEIPILLTEGGKKGLCGLSYGYVAIAGFGVDAFTRKGENQLLPELLHFVHPKRQWGIAFDEDSKRSTRRRVRRATSRLGRYLVEAGNSAENIFIAQWEPAQGKGLDDLVVQSGADALHQAIAQAMPLPAWKRGGWDAYLKGKYPEIFGLTHTPGLELNQRYLPALQLPQLGGILAISSAMGTGKTEVMKSLIAQAKALEPNCLIELIGYRNSLGKQSAKRLRLDHIHDLQGSYAQTFIDTAQGLAYCLDSLHRRIERVLRAIANGQRVLVLLDEIDAVLKHLFLGSTLGKRRAEIMLMLCKLLQAIGKGGGWVVCGEADLTSLPIAFLEAITGKPAQVALNSYQGNSWQIEAPMPLNAEYQPSPVLMGKAGAARILALLAQGKRVVAPTDSQRWGEVLERMAIAQGYKVIRLDGTTSEESWAHALMASPDAYLSQEKPQLFIYTPTAESGLSITSEHFDVMVAYGSHLEHRALIQLMGRIRADIPRVVYCRVFSLSDESGRATDPDALLKDWQLNARYSAMGAQLGDDAPCMDLDETGQLLHEFAAKYQARINASQAQLRENLLKALKAQGHQIELDEDNPLDEAFSEQWKQIRADIEIEQAEEIAAADIAGMELSKALRIMASSSSKREERVAAQKVLTLDSYPNLPVDDADFVLRNLIKSRGQALRQHTALFLAEHPEVAREIDRMCWQQQAANQMLWLPSIKREVPKATLLSQSGLLELLELKEYREDSPEAQRVRDFAIHYQADIKRVLGLWCAESHTAIEIVNKLARRLGHEAKILRKEGPRGAQTKIWGWMQDGADDRSIIHASLREKWADILAEFLPVASISNKESTIAKIESTDPKIPSGIGSQLPPDSPPDPLHEYIGGELGALSIVPPPTSPNEGEKRRAIA